MSNYGFTLGSIVYLNSGSPPLTVTQDGSQSIQVMWVNEKGDRQMMTADAACFTSHNPNPPPLDNED